MILTLLSLSLGGTVMILEYVKRVLEYFRRIILNKIVTSDLSTNSICIILINSDFYTVYISNFKVN